MVKLWPTYKVYVKESDLAEAENCPTLTSFVRKMVDKVYSTEALTNATPSGMPPRGKGVQFYTKRGVPPRLHPDGFKALFGKFSGTRHSLLEVPIDMFPT